MRNYTPASLLAAMLVFQFSLTAMRMSIDASLHNAARKNQINEVSLLINNGAPIDGLNEKGLTALHLASLAGHKKVVALLLAFKANPLLCTPSNETSLHLAEENGHEVIVKMLRVFSDMEDSDEMASDKAMVSHATEVDEREKKDSKGRTPLLIAAESGDLVVVQNLVDNGAHINARNNNEGTPLHAAALKGHEKVCSFLVKRGADLLATNKYGNTALHAAAIQGHTESCKVLIQLGTPLTIVNKEGQTPEQLALLNGKNEVAHYLASLHKVSRTSDAADKRPKINKKKLESIPAHMKIKPEDVQARLVQQNETVPDQPVTQSNTDTLATSDLEKKDAEGKTALLRAILAKSTDEAKSLILKGANVNASDSKGATPLGAAVHYGNLELSKLLIDYGADINAKHSGAMTPLSIAAENGFLDIIILLVSKGVDCLAGDSFGETPLHSACEGGHLATVNYLLDQGADVNASTNYLKETPLCMAASGGFLKIVQLLVERGARLENRKENRPTPLIGAARGGYYDIVDFLLERAANKQEMIKDLYGSDLLIFDVKNAQVMQSLIKHGADIHVRELPHENSRNLTLLGKACFFGEEDGSKLIETLLKNHAHVNERYKSGDTPLHYVAEQGLKDLVNLLLLYGADPSLKNDREQTARDSALKNGKSEAAEELRNLPIFRGALLLLGGLELKQLLEKGTLVNVKNERGETPLYKAASLGKIETLEILLNYGADINAITDLQESPLHIAAALGLAETVKFLIDKGADVKALDITKSTALQRAKDNNQKEVVGILTKASIKGFFKKK